MRDFTDAILVPVGLTILTIVGGCFGFMATMAGLSETNAGRPAFAYGTIGLIFSSATAVGYYVRAGEISWFSLLPVAGSVVVLVLSMKAIIAGRPPE